MYIYLHRSTKKTIFSDLSSGSRNKALQSFQHYLVLFWYVQYFIPAVLDNLDFFFLSFLFSILVFLERWSWVIKSTHYKIGHTVHTVTQGDAWERITYLFKQCENSPDTKTEDHSFTVLTFPINPQYPNPYMSTIFFLFQGCNSTMYLWYFPNIYSASRSKSARIKQI